MLRMIIFSLYFFFSDGEANKLRNELSSLQEKYKKESELLQIANEELDRSHKRCKEFKETAVEKEDELLEVKGKFEAEIEIMEDKLQASDYDYFTLKKQYEKDMSNKGCVPDAESKALELKKENANLEDDNYQLRFKIDALEKELEKYRT